MKNVKMHLVAVFVFAAFTVFSQDRLDLQSAIETGLENNFGIRLVQQDVAIANNNNTLGNAGFLPRLNLTGSQNFSVTNSNQEYLSGITSDKSGAKADALNAGLQLNWMLFDGLRMFRRYDQLGQLEKRSELQLLLTVENTISDIHAAYYTLAQLNYQKEVLEKTLAVDNERLQLAVHKLETGAGSRLEVLQSQVDMNADSAMYLNLIDQIERTRISLNQLMGRDPQIFFTVKDSIVVDASLNIETLQQQMLERNTMLEMSRKDEQIAQLSLREVKGRQLPEVGFNLGYNFTNQQSESGFLIQNRSSGVTYGLNASMSLFNGFNTRREQQNLQIEIASSRIRLESLINELNSSLQSNFGSYQNKLRLLNMERQNLLSAIENLDIAKERFNLGDLSGFEFREAQRNYLLAEARLLNVLLDAKLLETSLLQLAGKLVVQ
jgi:outer membrane protein